MNSALERLNDADDEEAESMFRDCCGSMEWARRMAKSRPFMSESELIDAGAAIWNELPGKDWLDAFSAHPKIGETKSALTQQEQSAEWSRGEQSEMHLADDALRRELSAANRAYADKFGFIFIVCATGKSAGEMLELCHDRLDNDRATEIANAATEQQKITEIRLRKLLAR
jgi:OHCU decarboxylase